METLKHLVPHCLFCATVHRIVSRRIQIKKTQKHTQGHFIISCTVRMRSGMHPRRVPCEGVTTVVPYYDYMYYNCFTLKLTPGDSENMYGGIVVVLQLNNHEDIIEQQKYLTPHSIPGQMSGALMIYNQPNHLPDVVRNSINLPSGHSRRQSSVSFAVSVCPPRMVPVNIKIIWSHAMSR